MPPNPGGRVTLGKLLLRTGRPWRPRPRTKNLEKEKSCQAPYPASPPARPAPSPPAAQAGAAPPPVRRPLSLPPGHTPCPLLAFRESRLSPSPTHLPGRLRRSPLTPPAATVHTHRLRSRTHSPSLTQRDHRCRAAHILCVTRVLRAPRASARASRLGARFGAVGGRRNRKAPEPPGK